MINLGLQRISRLLAHTPLPWRAIHVAGTNGKGSICAYISAMLSSYNRSLKPNSASSLRHGRFTSPHLVDRWDCISIDETPVSGPVFKAVEKDVLDRNRKMEIGASEFEVLTATAFEIFTREKVDVGVVEVGMGGRLDATNVLGEREGLMVPEERSVDEFRPMPLVSVISSIGLDHQAFLGNTLEAIAREKAGIIREYKPVVIDDLNPKEVLDVLRSIAEEKQSVVLDRGMIRESPLLNHLSKILENRLSSAVPKHVQQNITLAYLATWAALQELECADILDVENAQSLAEIILEATKSTTFPGRQQTISLEKLTGRKEDVLLDGAHNAQSAMALAETVYGFRRGSKVTWVLGASDTKDVTEILSPLLKDGDAVFAVEFGPVDGMPWVSPLSARKILEAAEAVVPHPESLKVQDCGNNVFDALESACRAADGGSMVIAGSLYLVGDVLRLLRGG